jgi:hypothetical protein
LPEKLFVRRFQLPWNRMKTATFLILLIVICHSLPAQVFQYDINKMAIAWEVVANSYQGKTAFSLPYRIPGFVIRYSTNGKKPTIRAWGITAI